MPMTVIHSYDVHRGEHFINGVYETSGDWYGVGYNFFMKPMTSIWVVPWSTLYRLLTTWLSKMEFSYLIWD